MNTTFIIIGLVTTAVLSVLASVIAFLFFINDKDALCKVFVAFSYILYFLFSAEVIATLLVGVIYIHRNYLS